MENIQTEDAPKAIGPYSQAVKSGQMVFCSGQIPLKADGSLVSGGVDVQTEQVITNLENVLKAAGGAIGNVVKTTVYLSNMSDFSAMNSVYEKYFIHKPARATIQAARLPKDVAVEIDCIAILE